LPVSRQVPGVAGREIRAGRRTERYPNSIEESPMKTATFVFCLVLLALPLQAADPAAMKTPSGWFDMVNCAFCKFMVEDPQLIDHVTWETHAIKQGMLSITTVDPAYKEKLVEAHRSMEKLGKDMHAGKIDPTQVKMCGHCVEYGKLLAAGVETEMVHGHDADVTLMTSGDPKVVEKIQAYAERNRQEFALLAGDAGGKHKHAH
jgi:hypothetical protein